MKTLGALQDHYNSNSTTKCDCWLVVCRDGDQLGFTEHPENLNIDGVTYEARTGFDRTATEVRNGLNPDNHNLIGSIDGDRITEEDILGRKYEGATVYHFSVDYTDPTGAQDKQSYGFLGETKLNGKIWEAEFTSLSVLLERELCETRGPYCRVKLGSSRCGITLQPQEWSAATTIPVGTVVRNPTADGYRYTAISAGVTSAAVSFTTSTTVDGTVTWEAQEAFFKHFSVVSVTEDKSKFEASVIGGVTSAWYQFGECVFSTGNNAGWAMDVKADASTGHIEVLFDYPFTIEVGDSGSLTVGCNHKLRDAGDTPGSPYTGHCRSRFSNTVRNQAVFFQGDPETPGLDAIVAGDYE